MNSISVDQKTVDVKLFFYEVTQGYSELTSIIRDFSQNLINYSPENILSECHKIKNKREQLSLLDQQLYKIVDLTKSEIRHETFVVEYRKAFKETLSACDNLYTNLVLTKAELLFSKPSS